MKRKQVLALSCAIMMGTTTIAGFPMSVRAEEHIQMLEAVDDDAFLVAETDGIEIPENEKNVALGKSVTASSQENWWMEKEDLLPDGPAPEDWERRVLC